jgi:hypothetical protein
MAKNCYTFMLIKILYENMCMYSKIYSEYIYRNILRWR